MEIQYRYSWDWFKYHAEQRLIAFRYFLILFGIFSLAYARIVISAISDRTETAANAIDDYRVLGFIVALVAAFVSVGFWLLEVRNYELMTCGRKALLDFEKKIGVSIRQDDEKRKHLKQAVGIFSCFFDWSPLHTITTHKIWLRLFYFLFFTLSLSGLGYACYGYDQLKIRTSMKYWFDQLWPWCLLILFCFLIRRLITYFYVKKDGC